MVCSATNVLPRLAVRIAAHSANKMLRHVLDLIWVGAQNRAVASPSAILEGAILGKGTSRPMTYLAEGKAHVT